MRAPKWLEYACRSIVLLGAGALLAMAISDYFEPDRHEDRIWTQLGIVFLAVWGQVISARWADGGRNLVYQTCLVAGVVIVWAGIFGARTTGWLIPPAVIIVFVLGRIWWDRKGRTFIESGRGF